MRFLLFATLVAALVPLRVSAADRVISVATFTRVRVQGPFLVEIRTGASPSARVSGDQAAVDRVDLAQTGETLTVRVGGAGWGERPVARQTRPLTIVLATPRLDGLTA